MVTKRQQSIKLSRRWVSPSFGAGAVVRGRTFARQQQAERAQQLKDKKELELANKIVSDVNAGRIKSVNQIPQRFRSMINISQTDLNKINKYYTAKKEADLWEKAFKQAETAISRRNPFIVAFSDNPYVKQAYKQLTSEYAAYKQRKTQIENIRSGKTTGVEIRGGRIWDTRTGTPITPMKATQRQNFENIQAGLPAGEILVKDTNYNIIGIRSSALGRSFQLDTKGVEFYNREMSKKPEFDLKSYAADLKAASPPKPQIVQLAIGEKARIGSEIINAKMKLREGNMSPLGWYQNLAQWSGGTLVNAFIDMGLGGRELYLAFKKDPESTLKALPSGVLLVLKQQFKKATSGDPLALGEVGIEFFAVYGSGRALGELGKLTKNDKFLVGVARNFSPKYFNKIVIKNIAPPFSIRKAIVKTPTGRIVADSARIAFDSTVTAKKFKTYSARLKAGRVATSRKIDNIVRRAKKAKRITAKVIGNLESRTNLNKQYNRARKNFKKSMEKKASIKVGDNDYIKAVVFIEGLTATVSKISAKKFLKDWESRGGKIGLGKEEDFIRAVQNIAKKKLNSLPEFKELKNTARLKKSFQINLRKMGKIKTAKIMFKNLKVKIGKLSLVKKMRALIEKISKSKIVIKGKKAKRKVKRTVRKVGVGVRKIKGKYVKVIKNLESRTNLNKQYIRARGNFKKSMQKKAAITVGNNDYVKAVVFIEGLTATVSKISAKKFLKDWESRGGKIGLGKEEDFIRAVQNIANKNLNAMSSIKELKNIARLKKSFQIDLRKRGKIKTAKTMFKNLKTRIKSTYTKTKMSSEINKLIGEIKRVKRKVSPRRIKKRIERRREVAKYKKFVKQTFKYQIEKARPVRKVSLDKLKRSQKVSEMNSYIDNFFNELNKRQRINLTPLKFSQMKNILKKRMRKAINKGNLPEINNFRIEVGKVVADMNKKSSKPNVKIQKTTGKDRRIRTIKDFEPETPKGTYREVKVGNQVMLQEVKQIQKPRQVQAMKQPTQKLQQKYKVVSVQKKAVNLKPLLQFGVKSLSAVAVKNMSKQAFVKISNQGQLTKVLQDSAQDLKVFQSVGQASGVNVASAVISAVRSKTRFLSRLKTKQVLKKKKKPVVRLKKEKIKTRKLSKPVQTYGFIVKKRGRMVRAKLPPLTLRDAWDVGSYKLDHQLQRTGKLIPLGKNRVVARLSKNVAGYYSKHSKKFRRAKIKKGKVLTLQRTIIEKKKYVGDTLSERRELQKLRKTAALKRSKHKPIKRTAKKKKSRKRVIARKKLPTSNSLKARKKRLLLKRKRMINKLKRK